MQNPLVSIIVPTYNAGRYLKTAISSLINQSYNNIEIIVVDDGSTDGSIDIIRTYSDKITIIEQTNKGQGIARNHGCKEASGSLFAFLDSDDLWDTDKLATQVAILQQFPQAIATYCDYRTIDENGNVTQQTSATGTPRPSGQALPQLLMGNCIGSPSVVLVRREAFEKCGGFNESPSRAAEDYGLWLSLATIGPILYSLKTLVSYRRHIKQTTNDARYSFNRALGNLTSFDRIADYMNKKNQSTIRLVYNHRLWEHILTLEWAARCYGHHAIAFKCLLRALRLRPWRLDIFFDRLIKGVLKFRV